MGSWRRTWCVLPGPGGVSAMLLEMVTPPGPKHLLLRRFLLLGARSRLQPNAGDAQRPP